MVCCWLLITSGQTKNLNSFAFQVTAESDQKTFVYQGHIHSKDFGKFHLTRQGRFACNATISLWRRYTRNINVFLSVKMCKNKRCIRLHRRGTAANNAGSFTYTCTNMCLCAGVYARVGLSVSIPRPRNHGDGPIKPLHKQQLCGSSHLSSFLCPHPLWICLLPLQAQVSYILNISPSRKQKKKTQQPAEQNTKQALRLCSPSLL